MKKIIIITMSFVFGMITAQQKKKTSTYEQHRSAETGRYVSKEKTKSNPNTTYTVKRKK